MNISFFMRIERMIVVNLGRCRWYGGRCIAICGVYEAVYIILKITTTLLCLLSLFSLSSSVRGFYGLVAAQFL